MATPSGDHAPGRANERRRIRKRKKACLAAALHRLLQPEGVTRRDVRALATDPAATHFAREFGGACQAVEDPGSACQHRSTAA